MKHLFNNISQDEKQRILEMHKGTKMVFSEQSEPTPTIKYNGVVVWDATTKKGNPDVDEKTKEGLRQFSILDGFVKDEAQARGLYRSIELSKNANSPAAKGFEYA